MTVYKTEEDTLKLQKDTDLLGSWARKWGMRFQLVKCIMMQLTNNLINKSEASYTSSLRPSRGIGEGTEAYR